MRNFLLAVLAMMSLSAFAEPVYVGRFSQGDLNAWTAKKFSGETQYSLVEDGGRKVLKAVSKATASGLYKQVHIDLQKTPYLNWSWKIDHTLGDIPERKRAGDDYPARVYVVFSGGLVFWRTRAINYVWSSNQAVGTEWPNAFTDHALMVAVASGAAQAGQWVKERRNVLEDFKRLFGGDIRYVDAVAVMTDTDNSGKSATAYYGDIYFSAQ